MCAVIVKALECNVFKKTNFFCDVIKGDRLQLVAHGKFRQASREVYIFEALDLAITYNRTVPKTVDLTVTKDDQLAKKWSL